MVFPMPIIYHNSRHITTFFPVSKLTKEIYSTFCRPSHKSFTINLTRFIRKKCPRQEQIVKFLAQFLYKLLFGGKKKEISKKKKPRKPTDLRGFIMTCVRRFELPTPWSVAKCSIQLSYTHNANIIILENKPVVKHFLPHYNTTLKPLLTLTVSHLRGRRNACATGSCRPGGLILALFMRLVPHMV